MMDSVFLEVESVMEGMIVTMDQMNSHAVSVPSCLLDIDGYVAHDFLPSLSYQ